MPTSKVMEKARLQTFTAGDGWIHDTVRGHGANSKKVYILVHPTSSPILTSA